MKTPSFSQYNANQIATLVPEWLRVEAEYANGKYGDDNPQYEALKGGLLDEQSPAYQEFPNYYGRFVRFFRQSEGSVEGLLRASQALGKFVGAGRALTRVLIEADQGVPREEADRRSFVKAKEICASIDEAVTPDTSRLVEYFDDEIEPLVWEAGRYIAEGNLPASLGTTRRLLLNQARVFVDFSHETGIIAQPGVPSTDEDGALGLWTPPQFC